MIEKHSNDDMVAPKCCSHRLKLNGSDIMAALMLLISCQILLNKGITTDELADVLFGVINL